MKIHSLQTRFIVSACLLLMAIVICGAWTVIAINRFGTALGDTLEQHQETINVAAKLLTGLERENDALLLGLNGNVRRAAEELRSQRQQFEENYTALEPRLDTKQDREKSTALRTHVDAFRKFGDAMMAAAGQPAAFDIYYAQVNPALRAAVADCRYFRESNVDAMQQEGVEARRDARRSSLMIAGIASAAFLASAFVLARLTRSVMRPLKELGQGVEAVRRDQLDCRVNVRSADELGRLAEGFNRMAESLVQNRRETEDRFRQLAENIHEIFWVTDAQGDRILYISPGYEGIWGRTCQSLYEHPRSWIDSVHPDDRASVVDNWKQRRDRVFEDLEFRIVRADGVVRWIRNRAFPISDLDGNVARIAGLAEDITERKRAEDAVRESEHRWRSLTEALPQLVWSATPDGACDYFSAQWTEHTGVPEDLLLGWQWMETLHPDDREPTRQFWSASVAGHGTYDVEYRVRRLDGEYRWFKTRGVPIRDTDGGIFKWFGSCTDITDSKLAEEELRHAKEAAESANRAKDEFLANVSHEIRTPMNAILGMTELTLDTPLSDDQRQCLKTVKAAADNLLGVINDLLDFAKIEAGKLELEPADFSLRSVLGDTLRTLATRAHRMGLELIGHVQPSVPDALVGDAGRLRQVLLNLIGNAIKFTVQGEIVVRVETAEDASAGDASAQIEVPEAIGTICLRFTVVDTGIGIPQDKQEKIFRAFEQEDTSTTRKYGGTGLGLSIAARLVALMGGTITVASETGRGSAFTFTAWFGQQSRAVEKSEIPPVMLRDLRVLVVDDNPTNRRLLDECLRGWQMEPTGVGDGLTAMGALWDAASAGRPYPLVLLDGRMPDTDGLALAAQIRERSALSATRIILLTSGDRPGDPVRSRELRIDARLLKPVQQSELLETIYKVMNRNNGDTALAVAEPARDPARISVPISARLNILVAEDNEFIAQLMERLVLGRGHRLRLVNNGREALAFADAETFDLLLLDVHMPEMDGFQVIRTLRTRELETKRRLPVIALTARSRKEDRERCLAAGMDDFLTKPVSAAELFAAIERLVSAPENWRAADVATGAHGNLLDPIAILSACGDDAEGLRRMSEGFQTYAPLQLTELCAALRDGDSPRLCAAAHKFCPLLLAFSTVAGNVASDLEDLAAAGQLEKARPLIEQLETMVRELLGLVSGLSLESLRLQTEAAR